MNITVHPAVVDFIESLEQPTFAKVSKAIDLLEEFENFLTMPHSKSLGGGIFELRIRGKQEVRLLYGFHERHAAIVHGFVKKTRQTPHREIGIATKRLQALDGV